MEQVKKIVAFPSDNRTAGFTLVEMIVCLAILSVLIVLSGFMRVDSVKSAQAVEATIAIAEVTRLESLRYADTGTYSSDLNELGFRLPAPLKHTELFVQVNKDAKGWSYMAFAIPSGGNGYTASALVVGQHAGGTLVTNLQGTSKSPGVSACSIWTGWESMEGGRIDGEESIRSSSGPPPCAGMKVVSHGKK